MGKSQYPLYQWRLCRGGGILRGYCRQGYISGRLFYNLGNAYFKAGELGRAVLNYNRAQKLMPYDKDVTYNLAVANGYVKDKIDTVPEFFLSRWIKAWRSSLDSNTWAARSLVLLAVALAGVLVFLLEERSGWRKVGFVAAVVFTVLFVFAVVFAAVEKRELTQASEAIVMVQAASVKSAPEKEGSDIFILHEGTEGGGAVVVRRLDRDNDCRRQQRMGACRLCGTDNLLTSESFRSTSRPERGHTITKCLNCLMMR